MFESWQTEVRCQIELGIDRHLPLDAVAPCHLHAAMRYAALGQGKRIRALLVCASADLFASDLLVAVNGAVAVELIHAYSLVHDDMPCMDDDSLRRGKPTVHIAYDEATAMLVGDALQALAFEVLVSKRGDVSSSVRLKQVELLSKACGSLGMVGGQALDLIAVGNQISRRELENMHVKKTGALIDASIRIGALYGSQFDQVFSEPLSQYASTLGLGFQVIDDILDVVSSKEVLGKSVGKDARDEKPTFVTIFGLEKAKKIAESLFNDAEVSLSKLPHNGGYLKDLTRVVFQRSY